MADLRESSTESRMREQGEKGDPWALAIRYRAALEAAAAGLADASEALDIAGLQVDASDAHQAHRAVREALEGP